MQTKKIVIFFFSLFSNPKDIESKKDHKICGLFFYKEVIPILDLGIISPMNIFIIESY